MRLKDIIGDIKPEDFFKQVLLPGKLLKFKLRMNIQEVFPLYVFENFVKNNDNFTSLQFVKNGKYDSICFDLELKDFYNQIQKLEGNDLWDFLTRNNQGGVHVSRYLKSLPEMRELSLDIFKYTPFGGQSYAVISRCLKESPYSHHEDPMDLFAIQVHGQKKWKFALDENGVPICNLSDKRPYDPEDPNQKYLEIIMNPGDVIFVPFQVSHYVQQIGEEVSIHFVIGVTRNFKAQGQSFLKKNLDHELFSNEMPFELRDNDKLFLDDFKKFKTQLIEYAEKFDPESEYKQFMHDVRNYDLVRTYKG